jgi:hypothetical protein
VAEEECNGRKENYVRVMQFPLFDRILNVTVTRMGSRDSSVGIGTGYGLDDRGVGVRVQTGSGTHPASYPIGTGGSFPEGKAAGA